MKTKQWLSKKIGEKSELLLSFLPTGWQKKGILGLSRIGISPTSDVVSRSIGRPSTAVKIPGIGELSHPIGIGAGFVVSPHLLPQVSGIGASFIEMGTITLKPEVGGPRANRIKKVPGGSLQWQGKLNNHGVDDAVKELVRLDQRIGDIPLGINLGAGSTTPIDLMVEDCLISMERLREFGKYFVLNIDTISRSGNSNEIADFLRDLACSASGLKPKIWIKLPPFRTRKEFQKIVGLISDLGYQGLILTGALDAFGALQGKLSGGALSIISTTHLEWAYQVHKGQILMIASGGIFSGSDIYQKMIRGAQGVEIFSALIYRGPLVIEMLLEELRLELERREIECLSDIIGSFYN